MYLRLLAGFLDNLLLLGAAFEFVIKRILFFFFIFFGLRFLNKVFFLYIYFGVKVQGYTRHTGAEVILLICC